jgi:nucleoside-diphosphate-sugar epimerase
MNVLFIGGTGNISASCARLAAERGIDLTLLTRGEQANVKTPRLNWIKTDINDRQTVLHNLGATSFDAIVNWVAFEPNDIERDLELFRGRTRQYVFISSASVYRRSPQSGRITESNPLANSTREYTRNKIDCETRLLKACREEGFPVTIVRPSLTYAPPLVPLPTNSRSRPYTIIDRMLKGHQIVVPGDGSCLWTITHSSDFAKGLVGLIGQRSAIGQAFHITSDEAMTWNQFYLTLGSLIGIEPRLIHMPSEFIAAQLQEQGDAIADKAIGAIFDNTKIKSFVPDYVPTKTFAQGMTESLLWFDNPFSREVDSKANATWDNLIDAYKNGRQVNISLSL